MLMPSVLSSKMIAFIAFIFLLSKEMQRYKKEGF